MLDGRKFFELDIGGGQDLKELDQIGAPAVDAINARLKNIPFTATAGVHRLGVTFLHRSFAESDRQLYAQVPGGGQDTVLTLNQLEIFGPVNATGLSSTPSRDKIFVCRPRSAGRSRKAVRRGDRGDARARSVPRRVQRRRPAAAACGSTTKGAASGGFEKGVEHALAGVLAHPKFLYRFEPKPESAAPGARVPARRASSSRRGSPSSYGARSRMPSCSSSRRPTGSRDPAVLEQQVERMLADPRAETLASNFAFQWLGLGELASLAPDPFVFADVDRDIRAHFVTESRLFVDSIFRSERSVLDLLTAEHTFVNEALARHYGLNDVRGTRFRRVELDDANRFGLLGKGGVLLVSSYPNRTSPVLRGQWLLENVLGTPPESPPPNVEALVEIVEGQEASTVRARLEAHRTNPSCNACHGVIDPLGFALENFDAVGRWRVMDREARAPIDASGVLVDGTAVTGPVELRDGAARAARSVRADFDREINDLRARPRRSSTRTCRRFGASSARPRRATTGFRTSFGVSSIARSFG